MCAQQRDFADATHSKSAKSAAFNTSYGIFSSENSYLLSAIRISNSLYGIVTSGNPSAYDAISYGA